MVKVDRNKLTTKGKKRVIMLLSNAFDPDPRVYQEAKSLLNNGYCVTIICWDRDYKMLAYEIIDGIKVERIYLNSSHGRGSSQAIFLGLFWIKAFFRLILRDLDIIHCHDFDTLPLGFLIGKLKRKKVVYDSHESYAEMLGPNVKDFIKKTIIVVENFLIRRIDLLITVGEILKQEFIKRGSQNVAVVGNWKRIEDFNFPKEIINEKRKEMGIRNGQIVISFISCLHVERKVPEILEAVKRNKDVFLILGGYGALEGLAEKEAQCNPNIVYIGFINPKDVPLYTCLGDVVFYGFDSENPNAKYSAPNKLFEALTAGKAIITGDFGEIGKIVKDEKCGVVLSNYSVSDLKNTLEILSSDSKLKMYQTNALMAAQKKYNWKNAETVLINEYAML